MLHDLHHGRRVEPREAAVAVDERAVEEPQALALLGAHRREAEALGGDPEGARVDVHPHDLRHLRIGEQALEELAVAAAEIDHPPRAGVVEDRGHQVEPAVVEAQAGVRGRPPRRPRRPRRGRPPRVRLPFGGETGEDVARQPALVAQVAAGDHLPLGVRGEPAAADAQELLHLGVAHPVVLVVVEHRDQHVEVGQQVAQGTGGAQADREVRAHPPLRKLGVERMGLGRDRVAERLEEAAQHPLAAAAGERRQADVEGERLPHQLRARLAAPGAGGVEDPRDRHRQERRGDVRAVGDVLVERRSGTAHQPHGIDVEEKRYRAGALRRLGVEHVRLPEREVERLHPVRVLVEEEPQVGRRDVRGADREQHGKGDCSGGSENRSPPPDLGASADPSTPSAPPDSASALRFRVSAL